MIVYAQALPKILPAFTISSALTLRLKVTQTLPLDLNVDCTVAAGTYFLAGDQQSDDFLKALHDAAYTALVACGVPEYENTTAEGKPVFYFSQSDRISVYANSHAMAIDWTSGDGATIAAILGFSSAAQLSISASASQEAGYAPAYFWVAEDPAYLIDAPLEDAEEIEVMQAVAIDGAVKTQYVGSRYVGAIELDWMEPTYVWSKGVSYATAPTDPWVRNRPLECLWRHIRDGTRFRFYRSATVDTALSEVRGQATGDTSTTLTDTGKAFGTDPQEHAGKLLKIPFEDTADIDASHGRFFISSHTATVITVANALHNGGLRDSSTGYYIFDQRYSTYVLDLQQMKKFDPTERRGVNRWSLTLPVRRYV